MANKTLFQSLRGALLPKADVTNEAGGVAYALAPKQALAQYAATGCLNSTYYASADDQLQKVLALIISGRVVGDRKSTRLNSSHQIISYAVFCLKKKKQ